MSNCLLCYPNYSDSAEITGEGWSDSLPVTNVQDRFLNKVARTETLARFIPQIPLPDNDSCTAAIHINFKQNRYLTAFALCNHNFSRKAKIRVVIWDSESRNSIKQDFGWKDVWPRWFDIIQMRWADENFLYGQVTDSQLEQIKRLYLFIFKKNGFLGNTTSARWVSIYIVDSNNTDSYLQVGRLYMSEDWSPKYNMIYGAALSWTDSSISETALDGTKWFDKRSKNRTVAFQLNLMDETEGVNKALLLTQLAGITEDVLYIFDPDCPQLMQQRSFVGKLSELSPLEWYTYGVTSMSFKIEETV